MVQTGCRLAARSGYNGANRVWQLAASSGCKGAKRVRAGSYNGASSVWRLAARSGYNVANLVLRLAARSGYKEGAGWHPTAARMAQTGGGLAAANKMQLQSAQLQ